MTIEQRDFAASAAPLRVYLLGIVEFDLLRSLQGLLHEEVSRGGPATLILCEHPPTVTVGRQGSHGHFDLDGWEAWRGPCPVRWVNRAGGCWLHWPGQLAIYALLPLDRLAASPPAPPAPPASPALIVPAATPSNHFCQWGDAGNQEKTLAATGSSGNGRVGGETMADAPGKYVYRLRAMLRAVLGDYQLDRGLHAAGLAWWSGGRPIACWGGAVCDGTTSYGAILNVNPALDWFRQVRTGPGHPPMTSLERELRRPVRPALVRERVIDHFCRLFGLGGPTAFMEHPFLKRKASEHALVAAR